MTSAPVPSNLAKFFAKHVTEKRTAIIAPDDEDSSDSVDDMNTPKLRTTKGGFTIFIPTTVAWLLLGGLLFGQPFLSTWAQGAFGGGGQANAKAIEEAVSKALAPIQQEIATMKADITLQFNAMDVRASKLERASKAKETQKQ